MSAPVDTSTAWVEQIIDLLQSGQRIGDVRYLVALLRALAAERDAAVRRAALCETYVAARGTNRDYQEARANKAEAERDAARAEVAALRKALQRIAAPIDCGCVPCTGSCRSDDAKAIYFEQAQDIADEALAGGPPA